MDSPSSGSIRGSSSRGSSSRGSGSSAGSFKFSLSKRELPSAIKRAGQSRQRADWDKVEELLGTAQGIQLAKQTVGKHADGKPSDLPIHVAI
eukprot:COSAG01_NODE_19669_length_996_cov_1.907469_2_plen_91_part_01